MSFYVSKALSLVHSSFKPTNHIENDINVNRENPTIGGVISNSEYAWLAKGPHLEVINTLNGIKIGSWTFGGTLRDPNTRVICVDKIERPHGKLPLLAVAVTYFLNDSLICIFDAAASKVIRAIQVSEKTTSLQVIDSGCEISTIPGPLRIFDGIMSIGTASGSVYLIDMCLQACEEDIMNIDIAKIRDESLPCQMASVTFLEISKIEVLKTRSVKRGEHLAIFLNAVLDKNTEHFVLKGQDGEDRIHVNKEEVTVSSLHFCPQLASLLVGYNFGAFQMWNLVTLDLIYTSPVCDEHIPVTHFAIQEPVDDPKPFCYVWVAYSSEVLFQKGFPYAVMYGFCYSKKEHLEDYGIVYQGYQGCSIRFQMELNSTNDQKSVSRPRGGSCLRLCSINRGLASREGNEDVLTLCMAVWSIWNKEGEVFTYTAIFDLNQWYKEQMPNAPNWEDCSNYLIHVCVSDLVNCKEVGVGSVLDVYLPKGSLGQFIGTQRLEEHFYPTSLIFDLCCLREGGVIYLNNQGLQKMFLSQIESAGPLCLMKPMEIFQQIINLGLTPLFADVPYHRNDVPLETQRQIILDVALEQHLVGWLCKCASEWANGSFVSVGCSLDFMLNWGFQRLITIKTNCDKYCVPLFDYSEIKLDSNTIRLINSCCRQIKNLSSLFVFICAKLSKFLPNPDRVQEQCMVVHMLSLYYEVLQWLLNMGLLPECPLSAYPRTEDKDKISVPYASEKISKYFLQRRVALKQLNKNRFSCNQSLLFIDNLVELEPGGDILQREWQRDGGSGFYPPGSLQALMRTYLVEKMSSVHKHMIATYLFLDIAMTLDHKRYEQVIPQLIKFPTIFKVNLSTVKLTQAFWELDHGGFVSAIEQLLDPLILTENFSAWHHKTALRSFLLQDQQKLALLYLQVRQPPVLDEEDILTTISLYVANKMIDEAFYFEKHYQKQSDEEKLLLHLYRECSTYDNIKLLVNRALTPFEESVLLKFFKMLNNTNIEVSFYASRCRYLEAFNKYENSNKRTPRQLGLVGQIGASSSDYLMGVMKSTMPQVATNLLSFCQKQKTSLWSEVARPTPMSVFVHNPEENVQYKSTLIQAALSKAKTTFNDTFYDKLLDKEELVSEETPFLRTPTATPSQKRKATTILTPKVIDAVSTISTEAGPSAKRRKLSVEATSPLSQLLKTKLDTPIIKRRKSRSFVNKVIPNHVDYTPQSILKVRELVRGKASGDDFIDYSQFDESNMGASSTAVASALFKTPEKRKSILSLTPRKSISGTPKSFVHFEDDHHLPSVEVSRQRISNEPLFSRSRNMSSISARPSVFDISQTETNVSTEVSNDTSGTISDEVFYSPNTSPSDQKKHVTLEEEDKDVETENEINTNIEEFSHSNNLTHRSKSILEVNYTKDEDTNIKTPVRENSRNERYLRRDVRTPEREIVASNSPAHSPRSRKSYKGASTPVRSSPRLTRNASDTTITSQTTSTLSTKTTPVSETRFINEEKETSTPAGENIESPLKTSRKIQGRRSLSRRVLENNALSRLMSSPMVVDSLPKSRLSSVQFSDSKSETSIVTTVTKGSKEEKISHSEVKYVDNYASDAKAGQFEHDHSFEEIHSSKKLIQEMSESTLSDISVSLSENHSNHIPQLSESVREFMKELQNKKNHSLTSNKTAEGYDIKNASLKDKIDNPSDEQKLAAFNCSGMNASKDSSKMLFNHENRLSINDLQTSNIFEGINRSKTASLNVSKVTFGNNTVPDTLDTKSELSTVAKALEDKAEINESLCQKSFNTTIEEKDTDVSDISITLYDKPYDGPQLSDSIIAYIRKSQANNHDYSGKDNRNASKMNTNTTQEPNEVVTDQAISNKSYNQECTDESENVKEVAAEVEQMEVDDEDVNVYEGLSSDEDIKIIEDDDKKTDDVVFTDLSCSHARVGDPEMNNFEYSCDFQSNENTQMTREYIADDSLGNVLERNVLEENALEGVSGPSRFNHAFKGEHKASMQEDSNSGSSNDHEKAFLQDSNSSSSQSDKILSSQQTEQNLSQLKNKSEPVVTAVIEINSSSSESDKTDHLHTSYEPNLAYYSESTQSSSDNRDITEESVCGDENPAETTDESNLSYEDGGRKLENCANGNESDVINLDEEKSIEEPVLVKNSEYASTDTVRIEQQEESTDQINKDVTQLVQETTHEEEVTFVATASTVTVQEETFKQDLVVTSAGETAQADIVQLDIIMDAVPVEDAQEEKTEPTVLTTDPIVEQTQNVIDSVVVSESTAEADVCDNNEVEVQKVTEALGEEQQTTVVVENADDRLMDATTIFNKDEVVSEDGVKLQNQEVLNKNDVSDVNANESTDSNSVVQSGGEQLMEVDQNKAIEEEKQFIMETQDKEDDGQENNARIEQNVQELSSKLNFEETVVKQPEQLNISEEHTVIDEKSMEHKEVDFTLSVGDAVPRTPRRRPTVERDILDDMESTPVSFTSSEVHVDIMERLDFNNRTPFVKLKPSDILEYSDIYGDTSLNQTQTPTKRRRSSSVQSSNSRYSLPLRRSRRLSANSTHEDEQSNTLENRTPQLNEDEPTTSKNLLDDFQTSTPNNEVVTCKRSLRSRSKEKDNESVIVKDQTISLTVKTPKTRSKAGSVSQLPIIAEENKGTSMKRTARTKSVSAIEEYSTSRRLTRRQADIMQRTLENVSSPKTIEEEEAPALEEIDPILLLDKRNFEGPADPEEKNVYDRSPSTSIDTASVHTGRRTGRSASVVSDISVTKSDASTPKTRPASVRGNKKSTSVSPVTSHVRTRSRTKSVDEKSDVSEHSVHSSPPKKTKKNAQVNEETEAVPARTTRSRAKSVSSITSDKSNKSSTSTRSRKRLVSQRTDLPKIKEEK